MKILYLKGKNKCLVNIEPTHWEKLKVYWSKPETKRKTQQMINAKNLVKNLSNVGWLDKARKEAWMLSAYDNSRLINIKISLNENFLFCIQYFNFIIGLCCRKNKGKEAQVWLKLQKICKGLSKLVQHL